MFNVFFFHVSQFDLFPPFAFVPSPYPLNLSFFFFKFFFLVFNHFRSSYYCFVPTGNCELSAKFVTTCKCHLWISWAYSVLLLFLNSIRTNFCLCRIPLIKTCSPLLFITLASENIGLNWYSTFQCGSWRLSQPLKSSYLYLFIYSYFLL